MKRKIALCRKIISLLLILISLTFSGCSKPKPVVDKPVEKRIRSTNPDQIPNVKLLWKDKIDETTKK